MVHLQTLVLLLLSCATKRWRLRERQPQTKPLWVDALYFCPGFCTRTAPHWYALLADGSILMVGHGISQSLFPIPRRWQSSGYRPIALVIFPLACR